MKQTDVLIKWIGSKRYQSAEIIGHFPAKIKTYYEPFLGGGSMMFVVAASNIEIDKLVCTDLNPVLIELWKLVQTNPDQILNSYTKMWEELGRGGKEYYYQVRKEFNQDSEPCKFFFLLRTCRNGLVRFNRKKEFNVGFHLKRQGIQPERLKNVVDLWSEVLGRRNIEFCTCDYRSIHSDSGDFLYLDPPYATPKDQLIYYGMLEYDELWTWLRSQRGSYALSLNGFKDDTDWTLDVPKDLYRKHLLISNGLSKLDQLQQNRVKALDSLYLS